MFNLLGCLSCSVVATLSGLPRLTESEMYGAKCCLENNNLAFKMYLNHVIYQQYSSFFISVFLNLLQI